MKSLKNLLAALALTCAISSTILAGDIGTPGYTDPPPPPPTTTTSTTGDTTTTCGDIGTPGLTTDTSTDSSNLLLDAMLTIISGI